MNDSQSSVGIFWVWKSNLLTYKVPWRSGERRGDMLDCSIGHDQYWPTLQAQYADLRTREYDQVPRGRVLCRADGSHFFVYSSHKVIRNSATILQLYSEFGLQKLKTTLGQDEHYEDPASIDWGEFE